MVREVKVLTIAGGSCSGKTTLAKVMCRAAGGLLLRQDDYYLDNGGVSESGEAPNFDIPQAIDFERFWRDLNALKQGKSISAPRYDFVTHRRFDDEVQVSPLPVIIVEGIMVLHDDRLRELYDFSCFIECDEELRLLRRIKRDIRERGRTKEGVIEQFKGQVAPAHDEFVEPSKIHADLIISQSQYCGNIDGVAEEVFAAFGALTDHAEKQSYLSGAAASAH